MRAAVSILAATIVLSASSARSSDSVQPFETMRALQDMQDGISVGIDFLQAASEERLARFVSAVQSGAVDWTDRRNRAALLFYLVTGGDPHPVKPALEFVPKDTPDRKAIEQAFASAEAAQGDADASLNSIDPRDTSPEVAGAIALAQGRSLARRDRLAAIVKLRDARLLAPGGLIEEMSLRQEMLLLRSASEIGNLESLVARYLAVFARSVHARRFLADFVEIGERVWKAKGNENRGAVLNALAAMPDDPRMQAGLRLVRSLLVLGDRRGALTLIDASCGAPQEAARCAFYRDLASVYDSVETRKATPPTARFETIDRLLRQCADALLNSESGDSVGAAGNDIAAGSVDAGSGVIERSRAQIEEAERVLARTR